MDRLWVRFSIATTLVIIFATVSTVILSFLDPWHYILPDEETLPNLSPPPLTTAETDYLIETLSTQEVEWLDTYIYEDGFFSITALGSTDQLENIAQDLPKLDVLFYTDDNLSITIEEPLFQSLSEELDGNDSLSGTLFLHGQLPAEQIDSFVERLPIDEFLIQKDPFLVENLSLTDILQLLYEQAWQAIIISIILGIGLGIWLSHTLTLPLSRLTEAASAIGGKDLSRRVSVKGSKEVVELADTFNQMVANLERAERLRSQMMADVSHELRTPLAGLESNLRAALDKVHQLEEEELAYLYSQTHHLIQLVNDLHEISLAEAGQLPLTIKNINLIELVRQTVAMFNPLAEEKGITLEHHSVTQLQPVRADDLRLRQVLHNLLANAVRHTSSGGTVTIVLNQTNADTEIVVRDTGEGIAPDQVAHIFNRFYRTDPSRNRETGGAGLGLAIAKAIIEAHQGTLTATSQGLNCGTVFTITLPLQLK